MKVRTYLYWIIEISVKGTTMSLWISTRGAKIHSWLTLSYLCSSCFHRMHPNRSLWKTWSWEACGKPYDHIYLTKIWNVFVIYMDKPFMTKLEGFISMTGERRGDWEGHEMCELVHIRTLIHKTFSNDSTIQNLRYFNIIESKENLLRRSIVGHLIYWKYISNKT